MEVNKVDDGLISDLVPDSDQNKTHDSAGPINTRLETGSDGVQPVNSNEQDEEELEEGELKDDDDDDDEDDDDDDNHDGIKPEKAVEKSSPKSSPDGSEVSFKRKDHSHNNNSDGDSPMRDGSRLGEAPGNGTRKLKPKTSSTRSSSPSVDHVNRPLSFRSRHDSDSRHSSRSHSRSKRALSPAGNQQARLVSMRAKLLEAKSREIEMKFQRNKTRLTSASPISSTISLTPSRNLKTTVTKPPITYAENPNPVDLSPDIRKEDKSSKSSKRESKERTKSSKKLNKKKKKKSSSSPKKKKRKTSETPKREKSSEPKPEPPPTDGPGIDVVDHQGPKTPPDNRVLNVDDEQIEWPSYLIKMTTTQPSISYSVNPDSVAEDDLAEQPDTADLEADFRWYCNYFTETYDMDKSQAQHQACSIIVSSGCYGDEHLVQWLEQQGYSKQSDARDNVSNQDANGHSQRGSANLPLRSNKPSFTILKALKEITLPNGKILPRGTIQRIVHPYPRPDRVIPYVTDSFSDLH